MGSRLLISLSLAVVFQLSLPVSGDGADFDPDSVVMLNQYISAAERQAGAPEPCYVVAEHLLRMGEPFESIRWVNRGQRRELRLHPVTWRPYWYRAQAHMVSGAATQAVEEYNEALAVAMPLPVPPSPGLGRTSRVFAAPDDVIMLRTARVHAVVSIATELEARFSEIDTRLDSHRAESEHASNRIFELTRDIEGLRAPEGVQLTYDEVMERSALRTRLIAERDRHRQLQETARRAELEGLEERAIIERMIGDEPTRLEWAQREITRLLQERPDNVEARQLQQIIRERLSALEET
jgi:hypothetical protein